MNTCGICPKLCDACKRASRRSAKPYRIRITPKAVRREWVEDVWITSEDAQIILGCTQKELLVLAKRGLIKDNDKATSYRFGFRSVLKYKVDNFSKTVNIEKTKRSILGHVETLIAKHKADMAIIDEWLCEAQLTASNSSILYGRRVILAEPPKSGWYVYHLCFPNGGRSFYVGKGKGRRMYQHADEARKGAQNHKSKTIRKIWAKGQDIAYRVVFVSPSEDEAFAVERAEIATIGLEKLTNVTDGGLSRKEAGRILGTNVPPEFLNFSRFLLWLRWKYPYGNLSEADILEWRDWWATERIGMLRMIRGFAVACHHSDAIAVIDAEIEQLIGYTAKQVDLLGERFPIMRRSSYDPYPWIKERKPKGRKRLSD